MTEEFSTEAQVVAGSLWTCVPLGRKKKVKFSDPDRIDPRARAALDELTDAGLLRRENLNHLPDSPLVWSPTERMFTDGPTPEWDWLVANSIPLYRQDDNGSADG